MASLKHHFQLAMLSLDQSPCCYINFLGVDWFLSTKWSFSEAWSGRYQRKLAGSRFKTSYRKGFLLQNVANLKCLHGFLGRLCFFMQTNTLKINKSVESTLGPGSPVQLMAGVWESTWWRYHLIRFCELLLLATGRNTTLGCTDIWSDPVWPFLGSRVNLSQTHVPRQQGASQHGWRQRTLFSRPCALGIRLETDYSWRIPEQTRTVPVWEPGTG